MTYLPIEDLFLSQKTERIQAEAFDCIMEFDLVTCINYLLEGEHKATSMASDPDDDEYEELIRNENFPLQWIIDIEQSEMLGCVNQNPDRLARYFNTTEKNNFKNESRNIEEFFKKSFSSACSKYSKFDDRFNELFPYVDCITHAFLFNAFYLNNENLFFDSAYKVYQQGGWIYGWEGNYPQGKARIFNPFNYL